VVKLRRKGKPIHKIALCYICAMRVVSEIPHPELKITIFHWNNRYLIKLEAGLFEQTYKIPEYDVESEDEVKKLVTDKFVQGVIGRFNQMAESLNEALGHR
jgi:hypothetical protein